MNTNRCRKCGVEKTVSNFYRCSTRGDGFNPMCKECESQYKKNRRRTLPWVAESERASARRRVLTAVDKKRKLEWAKRRRRADPESTARRNERERIRRQSPECKRDRAKKDRSRIEDPVGRNRFKARKAVTNAVRRGKLARPCICQKCGRKGRTQGHHHLGYEHEHWLDVVWLCPLCHAEAESSCPVPVPSPILRDYRKRGTRSPDIETLR